MQVGSSKLIKADKLVSRASLDMSSNTIFAEKKNEKEALENGRVSIHELCQMTFIQRVCRDRVVMTGANIFLDKWESRN